MIFVIKLFIFTKEGFFAGNSCYRKVITRHDLVLGTAIPHILGILNMKIQQKAYIIKEYLQV